MRSTNVLKGVNRQALRRWLTGINGHGIMAPAFFRKMGFSPSLVHKYTKVHQSFPGDLKETILLPDGKVAAAVRGVYELEFVEALAERLGVNMTTVGFAHGRGRQAEIYASACLAILDRSSRKK